MNILFEFFGVQSQEELFDYITKNPQDEKVKALKEILEHYKEGEDE